jgi:nicotinate-nucleotide adenylyltransferase
LRLGIYGGTFDPPHLGHLILAEVAADTLALDRVLWVPAGRPPHKSTISPAEVRVKLVEAAIAGNERFELCRVDVDRPGPHYTSESIGLIREKFPGAALWFLMGEDSLRDLPKWRNPDELLAAARIGVMRRPAHATTNLGRLYHRLPALAGMLDWIDAPIVPVSGTQLRARIREGRSIRYMVSDPVRAIIASDGLYE